MKKKERKSFERAVLKGFRFEWSSIYMVIILPLFLFPDKSLAQVECSVNENCTGYEFCNFDSDTEGEGRCEPCPAQQELCDDIGLPSEGVTDCVASCEQLSCNTQDTCPEGLFCNYDFTDSGFCEYCPYDTDFCTEMGLPPGGVADCQATCDGGIECTAEEHCPAGLFCNQDDGFSGNCEYCPFTTGFCDDMGLPPEGEASCLEFCDFGSPCFDSPLPVSPYNLGCEAASSFCDMNGVPSHCPESCNACEEYLCEDSEWPWILAGGVYTCDLLASLSPMEIAFYCLTFDDVLYTCRSTCSICEI